ncbi:rhs element Vgr family protein, partial [Vibrio parahaemolyticus V-223/04]
TPIN